MIIKTQIKVRAYSTTFLIDYPKGNAFSVEMATEIVKKKVTHLAEVVSLLITEEDRTVEMPNLNFKDPEKFEILNLDISQYKKQNN